MCGACGRAVGRDRWTPLLSTTRARAQAARALNRFLAEVGSPARVGAVAGGWVVRSGTGRGTVTDTATGLWQALGQGRALGGDDLHVLRRAGDGPEVAALVEAAEHWSRAVATERAAAAVSGSARP